MKRLFVALLCLTCIFNAHADNNNTTTSKDYVDAQIATLQDEVPAINSNTVLTHTGTSGEIGSKKIYDPNSDYGSQTDALVTAQTFNSAVQNAIDTEFVCIESVPEGCLLWKIQTNTLPNGYTRLEYLKSDGNQWIDTGVIPDDSFGLYAKAQVLYNNKLDNIICGVKDNESRFWIDIDFSINDNLGSVLIGWNSYRPGKDPSKLIVVGTSPFIIESNYKNSRTATVNGEIYSTVSLNTSLTTPRTLPIYIFGANMGSTSAHMKITAKIWNIKITKAENLIHNYIPARRNSDNVLGMYDTIADVFLTNSGSGTFTAGPAVSSNLYLPNGN